MNSSVVAAEHGYSMFRLKNEANNKATPYSKVGMSCMTICMSIVNMNEDKLLMFSPKIKMRKIKDRKLKNLNIL
jgi:hypothetical protein